MGVTEKTLAHALHPPGQPPQVDADREVYACPELVAAGVPQIDQDIHNLWATWGDRRGDKRLTPDQYLRLKRSIAIAKKRLRDLHLEEVRRQTSWFARGSEFRSCTAGIEFWIDQEAGKED